jgi:hypothetical protein
VENVAYITKNPTKVYWRGYEAHMETTKNVYKTVLGKAKQAT